MGEDREAIKSVSVTPGPKKRETTKLLKTVCLTPERAQRKNKTVPQNCEEERHPQLQTEFIDKSYSTSRKPLDSHSMYKYIWQIFR